MKKILLFIAAVSVVLSASAQSLKHSELVVKNSPQIPVSTKQMRNSPEVTRNDAGKTTSTPGRWYNVARCMAAVADSGYETFSSLPLWRDSLGQINYLFGLRHNRIVSAATIIHPWSVRTFNDVDTFAGQMEITPLASYTIDSVELSGFYCFNLDKIAVVDTLQITLMYGGADLPRNIITDTDFIARFGVSPGDTLHHLDMYFDSVTNTAVGATAYTFNYLLNHSNWGDTDAVGMWHKRIALPVAMPVPAGNYVGLSFSFRSGDTSFVDHDTIVDLYTHIYKYNIFKIMLGSRNYGSGVAFPQYIPTDFNEGLFAVMPAEGRNKYYPMWNWEIEGTHMPSYLQNLYAGFHATCSTCSYLFRLDANTPTTQNNIKMYPNPADDQLTIQFNNKLNEEATVTLTDCLGQVVATRTVTDKADANFSINTSSLSSGVYICTIVANGERITNRVSITH